MDSRINRNFACRTKIRDRTMKIGVIAAMSSEREQLARLLANLHTEDHGRQGYTVGELAGHTIYIMECGIGKVNAAVGATNMMNDLQPDAVVSTGVAGGIDACVGVMEVVAASHVVYHDVWCGMGNVKGQVQGLPPMFDCHPALVQVAASLDGETPVHTGLICTGDQFISAREELDTIKANFAEGLAVDMESAAIAHVCHLYGVPFISFRIVSDTPGADGHWQQYENFWQTMADRSFGVVRAFLASLPAAL